MLLMLSPNQKVKLLFLISLVKYRGQILRVTSPALGSNDWNLNQSATRIQVLVWSRDNDVTSMDTKAGV